MRHDGCSFDPSELADWRIRLVALRSTLCAEARSLASTALAEASGDDAGQADVERAMAVEFATVDSDADLIAEIDLAIRRIDFGQPAPFGICVRTGRPIELERLDLVPWTPWCAAAARLGA